MDRIAELSIEVGKLEELDKAKQAGLNLLPGEVPMTMDEVARSSEEQFP